MDISASAKIILDRADTVLENIFLDGAEYPHGTRVVEPLDGYKAPVTSQYKDKIKAAFKATVLAVLDSGAIPLTQGNMSFNVSVTGNTPTLIGSIWLDEGTISTIRAYIGCTVPTDIAYLQIKTPAGGLQLELGQVAGGVTVRSSTNFNVPISGMYDLWLSASSPSAVALLRNLSWSYQN